MDSVQLLSPAVASQIAAGEVVSRPASVVKELVENSIDAGATHIDIVIADAGRTHIQVSDNGCGMTKADATLSFSRHATSKIRQTDDLYSLHTFGFRGEALPSIAAVAEVTLRTRTPQDETGTEVSASGPERMEVNPCVCEPGTSISVRNLFFNVPARRKFLKGNQTEFAHIMTEIERVSLAHPEVSFDLSHQGQKVLQLVASALRSRIVALFGKKMNQALLPVEVITPLVKISGFVSNLENARSRSQQQFFFVNGRFMKHPYFHKAVLQAFDGLVQAGDQPSYFLFIEVAPDQIDVNIHPTKTEIKFQDEPVIFKIIMASVRESLGKFEEMTTIDFNTADMPDIPVFETGRPASQPKVEYNPNFNPFKTGGAGQGMPFQQPAKRNTDDWTLLYGESGHSVKEELPAYGIGSTDSAIPDMELETESPKPLGQIMQRYILVEERTGLRVIDQHRAHVTVLFDRYMKQALSHASVSQGLLFPEMFQLSPSDYQVFAAIRPRLETLGFDLSDMGHGAVAVQGIPSGLEGKDFENVILEMIHDWSSDPAAGDTDSQLRSLALSMARSSAIQAGRHLSIDEMTSLLQSLYACSMHSVTPDGHNVYVDFAQTELAKRFS